MTERACKNCEREELDFGKNPFEKYPCNKCIQSQLRSFFKPEQQPTCTACSENDGTCDSKDCLTDMRYSQFVPKQQEKKSMKVKWEKIGPSFLALHPSPCEVVTISKCGKYYAILDIEVEQPEEDVIVTIQCVKIIADSIESNLKNCQHTVKSFTRSDKPNKESKCS